ncbi:acetyl-CoA carboxylase biotin carboxyl carrier protein [Rufibacter glacialis]|uniref:Biotin carboxyl carrier protein of acetyl-CoA carboxylase n=1 Tax=Rufibacter glacialis TaxID=1259555 RepID=A0A5M8QF59_9BACT|nr:acetyl-CoA carboxylase biotin carboxyl carrier protein [Rufibacter glacialis]KAA6434667.1 acetyl-CoA carboxylase biotin carboxyl carrier protein [Rufibacter glacialis]GGK71478.1 acetyl-CoA carboxylase, biotin carboxyl carrier protein [Rufibacter glacialis]
MKAKEIQELIDFIAKSGLNKVDIETEEFKISVQREASQKVKYTTGPAQAPQAPQALPAAPAPQAAPAAPAAPQPAADDSSKYLTIKAPMIGTLYRSANPETPAFVNVGDEVKKGQVICIIEAMKLFNEIESEVSGRIVKVLVDNSTPVEYDQPLFLVDPS